MFSSDTGNISSYKCFSCIDEECNDSKRNITCNAANYCWKSVTLHDGYKLLQRGCTEKGDQLFYCNPRQDPPVSKRVGKYSIECCKGDYCNAGSFPLLESSSSVSDGSFSARQAILTFCVTILGLLFVLSLLAIVVLVYIRRKRHKRDLANGTLSLDLEAFTEDTVIRPPITVGVGDSTLKEFFDQSITSGSGYGLPLLMQRTLARQISLNELIGKGKYGEVWRAVWHSENVAVKIFLSKDEASWSRETEIYNTILIRHPNILGYIGSDMTSRNSATQLWVVTHYHPYGSLYDYLNHTVITSAHMFKICYSIANGLDHLHSEIFGAEDKPAIAHRDIKSKNILVQENGECVLADFGLAVTYYQKTDKMTITPNPRVGTKRYMAPEVLDESMNMKSFESFKRADIYALGLVLWEICRRTSTHGIAEEYKPPFYDCVGSDPSFDEMKKVICIDHQRPVLPNRWLSDPITSLIKECWHHNAMVRPSSLRVKKSIKKLINV